MLSAMLLVASPAFAAGKIKTQLGDLCSISGPNELTILTKTGKFKGVCGTSSETGVLLIATDRKHEFIDRGSIVRIELRVRSHFRERMENATAEAGYDLLVSLWGIPLVPFVGGYAVAAEPICITIDLFSKLRGTTVIDIT